MNGRGGQVGGEILRITGKDVQTLILAKPPEITPLKAAEIRFARFREITPEDLLSALQIASFPELLHQVHVRDISMLAGVGCVGLSTPPLPEYPANPKRKGQA
jgi:hypothetical protein